MMNRQIVLRSRPERSPTADNFELVSVALLPVMDGAVLRRTIYLSLDPYMRGRMSDAESYAASVGIREVMVGGTRRVRQLQVRGLSRGTGGGVSLGHRHLL